MIGSGLAKVAAGGVIGIGLGYFFDPARGRERRAKSRAWIRSRARRTTRAIERREHYMRGRMVGWQRRLHPHPARQADDRTLVDRVRSEALGRMPSLGHRVSLDARDGVVTLRGQLENRDEIEHLIKAVRRVPGVMGVDSLLHLPGEVAPNKAAVLHSGA